MKNLPACESCIRTGFLCTSCQENLDEGEITHFELDLGKDLLELEVEERFSFLEDVSFYKAIDYGDVVIIVVGKGDKVKITDELINWINDMYEIEKILLIENTQKPRPVVESLIAPAKLVSLNEIFLATGEVEYKAVIRKSDKEEILFTAEELEDLVLELTEQPTRIEFV